MPTRKQANPHFWVANYADYLQSYAFYHVDDLEMAKDLVQETFMSALEGLARFDGLCSEKTWLTAILKNKIFDIYRRKSTTSIRQLPLHDVQAEHDEDFNDDNCNCQVSNFPAFFVLRQPDNIQNKELQGALHSCMKKLPPLWLSVFTMKHLNEESSERICAELKLTPSNFWVIVHRARINLRSCLRQKWI